MFSRMILVKFITAIFLLGASVVITNLEGEWEWANKVALLGEERYGTEMFIEMFRDVNIAVDSEGNTYIAGTVPESADFGNNIIDDELVIFIAKLDNTGEWTDLYTATGGLHDSWCGSIAIDNSDNIYITGGFMGNIQFGDTELEWTGGTDNTFVAKLNNEGNWEWANQTEGVGVNGGKGVAVDVEGNVYVTGFFGNNVVFGDTELQSEEMGFHLFSAKLNSAGEWEWANSSSGGNGIFFTDHNMFLSIDVDGEGNAYVSGASSFEPLQFGEIEIAGSSTFVAKQNGEGDWEWVRYASASQGIIIPVDLVTDRNGNIYLTGGFNDVSVVFHQEDPVPDIVLTAENMQTTDFIVKLDSRGVWKWARKSGGYWSSMELPRFAVTVDNTGNACFSGSFLGTAIFGAIELYNNTEGEDIFIASANREGEWQWVKQVRAEPAAHMTGVTVDERDNYYVVGYFDERIHFGDFELQANEEAVINFFIAKLDTTFPYPSIAQDPAPADESVDVPVDLSHLSWKHVTDDDYTDPAGFRVYFNDTGEFAEDDNFEWVFYVEDQVEYSSSGILPEQLEYKTSYYWKVVPTTKEDGIGEGEDALDVPVWSFLTEKDTSVDNDVPVLTTELLRNYPNPFNPDTIIKFSLKDKGDVRIVLYNLKGQIVRTLQDGLMNRGSHRLHWDGTDERGRKLSSGIYFYRMIAGDYDRTKKMLLME